jgi:signal transduction histidine kinase
MWSTPGRIRLCAAALGIFVWAVSITVDFVLRWLQVDTPVTLAASDALAGVFAAFFILRIMEERERRRAAVREHLRLVAELNHHIRNALANIQLSCYASGDRQAIDAVNESVRRIDWALREILGQESPRKPPRAERQGSTLRARR